jgi:hypothetical protein
MKFNLKNITLLSLLFFILLFLRRGEQLLNPQVWAEDGIMIIPSFLEYGWFNLIHHVNGYLITIPKLISNISMSISPLYYPEISTYITWAFTIFIALAVTFSPTKLHYKPLAAILIFLIPTNAENFGLPLYTLWFSAILLFLVVLWKQQQSLHWKNTFLILGGLSSPVIVPILTIQIFRTLFLPYKKEEVVTLILASIIAIVQLGYLINYGGDSGIHGTINLDLYLVHTLINKYFSFYYLGNFVISHTLFFLGGVLLLLLMLTYWFQYKKDVFFYILLGLLFASIALSVARANVYLIHPVDGGGARYFFFPYILLGWTLLYLSKSHYAYKVFTLPIITLSIILSTKAFDRGHDSLFWKEHLISCSISKNKYSIPIHYAGSSASTWHYAFTPEQCKSLIEKDIFSIPKNLHVYQSGLNTLPKQNVKTPFCLTIKNHFSVCDTNFTNTYQPIYVLENIDKTVQVQGWFAGSKEKQSKSCNVIPFVHNKIQFLEQYSQETPNNQMYKGTLNIPFTTPNKYILHFNVLNDSCTKYSKSVQIPIVVQSLRNKFNTTPKKTTGFAYNLDYFEIDKHPRIRIKGWFVELHPHNKTLSNIVLVRIGNHFFTTHYGQKRGDVAQHLKEPKYINAGYHLTLYLKGFKKGVHTAYIYALSHDRKTIFDTQKKFEFEVK